MSPEVYRAWRTRLDAALAGPEDAAPPGGGPAANAAAALAWARRVSRALGGLLPGGALSDHNHYGHLCENLPKLVEFETFSLAEYTYHASPDRHPGVRLWLDVADWRRRLGAILFEDVHQWRVDAGGRRLERRLVSLDLSGPEPALLPDGELTGSPLGDPWHAALAEALARPVLLYFPDSAAA